MSLIGYCTVSLPASFVVAVTSVLDGPMYFVFLTDTVTLYLVYFSSDVSVYCVTTPTSFIFVVPPCAVYLIS